MTNQTLTPFRFVWRNANAKRWFTTTVKSATPETAILAFQEHIRVTLNKQLAAVVVDHPFYSGALENSEDPEQDLQMTVDQTYSLRDFKQPFNYCFDNKVFNPS